MTFRNLLPFILAILFTIGSRLSMSTAVEAEALEKEVTRQTLPYIDSQVLAGVSVGIVKNGHKKSWSFGKTDLTKNDAPNDQTLYEIGSVTKVFTSILLANEVVLGKVSLDEPIGQSAVGKKFLPGWKNNKITFRHLATHSSGLPRLPSDLLMQDAKQPYSNYSTEQLYKYCSEYEFTREPDEKIEYSNLAVALLGQLLADMNNTDYESLLKERIISPLEMKSTTISLSPSLNDRLAQPYDVDLGESNPWELGSFVSAGAIRSTIHDMLLFSKACLTPPKGDLGKAINLAWEVAFKPISKEDFAMGLGWHIARDGSTRFHNGQTGGYHSSIFVSRKLNTAVVVLSNTATVEVDRLGEDLIRMTAGIKTEPRTFPKLSQPSEAVMQKYVGKFSLSPIMTMQVKIDKGRLMVGLTGQSYYRVYPRSDTQWDYRIVQATLTFDIDEKGECNSVDLFQNNVHQKATRIIKAKK